ncbi:S8 family serine peptidase [Streptomyces sp. NPDC001970]
MTPTRWRITLAGLVAGLLLPLGLAAPPAAAAGADQARAQAVAKKIDKKVNDRIAKGGKATFWVYLDEKANLSAADKLTKKADKAAYVHRAKTKHANRTQAGLRQLLTRRGADFTPFWLANTIKVTGDADLLGEIAARAEVSEIVADQPIQLPDLQAGVDEPAVNGVEWNIDRINAPRVWNELGVRGEGIVVANIDTGVNYTHPAVAASYRGSKADGSHDHNYNWFDPAGVCPSAAPCDNSDHGTHTMGTMVGLDGTNVIGVAPGAKWIAAKGCESDSCSTTSLLAAGQWIMAPTDLNGANPRPDLAPDIVNNSWGANAYDPWYQETVAAWVAADIFPAFANGNNGPACNTSGSPGTYSISYSSGAFGVDNAIAGFSSRGAGENGDIKPNIAAPGVDIRSSTRDGYASLNGTSMASPHTAATVALMWSASPAIRGDIAATRQILDDTAIDADNTTCGGTAEDNNVFGEGRLDAYAAVNAAPRGALGALDGRITTGGDSIGGATVTVDGPLDRTRTTAADGSYSFDSLLVGDYTITVTKFGYLTATATATVTEDQTAVRDIVLEQAPSVTLRGTVTTSEGPAAGASITLVGTPVSTFADGQGHYTVTVPQGEYDVRAAPAYRCADSGTRHVTVTGDTTLDIMLPDRNDTFGYACGAAGAGYVPGTEPLTDLVGDDEITPIGLPFSVPFYGRSFRDAWVSINGVLGFGTGSDSFRNSSLPTSSGPNLALYPFWDDLFVDADSGIYTAVAGAKPHRTFVVEWRNVLRVDEGPDRRLSFTAAISEDGSITYRYKDIDPTGPGTGTSATIGMENATGTDAFLYSYNSAAVKTGSAIAFRTTKTGVASGVVTDANDGRPVDGATVTAQSGGRTFTGTTEGDGTYLLQIPVGDVALAIGKEHYEGATAAVTLAAGGVENRSTALRTARVSTTTTELTITAGPDQTRARPIVLNNTGVLGTDIEIAEVSASGQAADIGWLALSGTTGTMSSGGKHTVGLTVNTAGLPKGSSHQAKLRITSASGRNPVRLIPVTLVVPSYTLAIDAGGQAGHADAEGQRWATDRAYTAGGYGYLGNSNRVSTTKPITGTQDPARFAHAQQGMNEYRVDGLADGYYTIELDFAELQAKAPNKRVFDVVIEGQEVCPSLDVANEVGTFAALTKTSTVQVTDGQLNVRFVTHKGFGTPIVNALRVSDRPDLAS